MSDIQANITQKDSIQANISDQENILAELNVTEIQGINTFEGLTDTEEYSGNAGKVPVVNATEDGLEYTDPGSGDVTSVNGQTGVVSLDADNIDDAATTNKFTTAANLTKLSGIESGAEVNNISDANATDLTDSGDSTLHYHASDRDRANHTGTQAASTISDFDTEVSNNAAVAANTAKVSNATHTGEVTGATALTIQPSAISGKGSNAGLAGTEEVLINNSGTLEKTTTQDIANLGGGGGSVTLIDSAEFTTATSNISMTGLNLTGYKFLKLIAGFGESNSSSTPGDLRLNFNGDTTTTNYYYRYYGNDNGTLFDGQGNIDRIKESVSYYFFSAATDQQRWCSSIELTIMYAGNTTNYTHVTGRTSAQTGQASFTSTGRFVYDHTYTWANTAAVTQIDLQPTIGDFDYGHYALYGYN